MLGQRFGHLVVLSQSDTKHGMLRWNVRCDCGTERAVRGAYLRSGKTRSCGCLARGDRHYRWNEGRRTHTDGYVLVYVGSSHPMAGLDGYVREHRLVMSEVIERPLEQEEVVHHINKVRTDNRIENLMLFANQSEHRTHHHHCERS